MGGEEAKYDVSESVSMMLNTLKHLSIEHTGIFIGEDGEEVPW